MSIVSYQTAVIPRDDELVGLYQSVGWSSYTSDPHRLASAINASLALVTAYAESKLIGLARLVGDGLTIVYLQDILVSPDYQRRGVGRELFLRAFAPYNEVRQKVLITDDEPAQRAFYQSLGFTEISDLKPPLRSFVKFD